jgi:MFS transporter, ACS family, tartrate transporter
LDGLLHGWQWMLLLEGMPSLLLGAVVLWGLPDRPANASWLSANDKAILASRLEDDRRHDAKLGAMLGLWEMLTDKRIWIFILPDFSIVIGLYGMGLWMPQMIKGLGFSNLETGFLVALPYIVAMAAMVLAGLSSDRSGERVWHTAIPLLVAVGGLVIAALSQSHYVAVGGLVMTMAGLMGTYGPYYTQSSSFLSGRSAPGAIALVNLMCTGLGGFIGPNVLGLLKDRTGGYQAGMFALAGGLVFSVFLLFVLSKVIAARSAKAPVAVT